VGIKVVKLISFPPLLRKDGVPECVVVGIEGVKLIFVPTLAAQGWGTRVVVEHAKSNFAFLGCRL